MSDEDATKPGGEPARRRSSAAAAASRARRIGGRVGPPSAATRPAGAEPVALTKTPERATRPAGPGPGGALVVPGWLRWAPAGVLSAGAVAMAVLLIIFSHGVWWGTTSSAVQREQVLAAAKTCLATANTYQYTALDAYEKKALACTTGGLTAKLRKTIDKLVRVRAPQLKAGQRAEINRAGIEAITKDGSQWTVLVFGQLAVTNTNYPKGRTDPFAAEVRMQKAHGQWLMSDLQNVSTPLSG